MESSTPNDSHSRPLFSLFGSASIYSHTPQALFDSFFTSFAVCSFRVPLAINLDCAKNSFFFVGISADEF
jgi:hypothetical protein